MIGMQAGMFQGHGQIRQLNALGYESTTDIEKEWRGL